MLSHPERYTLCLYFITAITSTIYTSSRCLDLTTSRPRGLSSTVESVPIAASSSWAFKYLLSSKHATRKLFHLYVYYLDKHAMISMPHVCSMSKLYVHILVYVNYLYMLLLILYRSLAVALFVPPIRLAQLHCRSRAGHGASSHAIVGPPSYCDPHSHALLEFLCFVHLTQVVATCILTVIETLR